MRDILFRGKRLDNGEWVYGYLVNVYNWIKSTQECHILELNKNKKMDDYGLVPYFLYGEYDSGYEVDPDTIGQYTGYNDINGKMIFENDILYDNYEEENCCVVFTDGAFMLEYPHILDYLSECCNTLEIISNLHKENISFANKEV